MSQGSSPPGTAATEVAAVAAQLWAPASGYLNAATVGLPPRRVVEVMRADLGRWQAGRSSPVDYDAAVTAARAHYARLVGVPSSWVATASQASVLVGNVAASLPDGAEVVTVADDFTSVIFPFLTQAQRGVTVRQVPREALADAVTGRTDLVAFSLVQSACGRMADAPAVVEAARRHGALTLADTTQAVGWLPMQAGDFDLTVCAAYKWLCQPRGTAYLTVRPEVLDRLVPVNAGWYAGESVWESVYGPTMRLAGDARRLDVSPAWLCWVGAAAAGEVFSTLATPQVRAHDAGLADALRARLGQEPQGRPVLTVEDPDGSAAALLAAAGAVVATRAGRVRIAFHVWNTDDDVELVAVALGR